MPLAEDVEAYDVEVLDGAGDVVRMFASQPAVPLIYSAANIAADFPSGLPSPFRFTVYQLSATYGRGVGATGQIYLSP